MRAVTRAKRLGLRVFLRPTVETGDGTPRAELHPRSTRAWFRSYRRFIEHYASLAQRLGVDMLSVGLEYQSLDGPGNARRLAPRDRGGPSPLHGAVDLRRDRR